VSRELKKIEKLCSVAMLITLISDSEAQIAQVNMVTKLFAE
jgi:hypothetical protein